MMMSRTSKMLLLLGALADCGVLFGANDSLPAISCPDAAGAVVTYQNLTIPEGVSLCFSYDPSDDAAEKIRTGRIDVEETLSLPERVTVKATYVPIASTTGKEIRNVILRAPAGTRIDPARFVFAPDASKEGLPQSTTYPQRIRLEVETGADGRDALVAVVEPIVALVKSADERAYVWLDQAAVSSFEKADEWSDGRLPHAGAHYVKALGWGNTPVGAWDFPGLSLLYCGAMVSFHATNQVTRFAELAIGKSGGTFMTDNASDIHLVGGRLELFGDLGLSPWNGRNVRIDSEIVGAGDLLCKTPTHGTSYHMGSYEFTAFNTNFTGRIDVDRYMAAADFVPRYDGVGSGGGYKTFRLHDGRNLGGARAAFAYDAFALGNFSRLVVTNDVTLAAGLNRGLFVEEGACVTKQRIPGGARVSVSDGATLAVRWPVTVSVTNAFPVTLWKEGVGTLALGGRLGFLTAGGLSDALPANAPRPVLSVTNGFVRALSADCLDGFTVTFAPTSKSVATGLLLDLDTDEAALRRYGIRNAKTDAPFGAGPIRIDVTGVPKMTRAGGTFGVLTVRTSVADDVASRLSVAWPEAEGLTCRFVRHADAAAGTTTFALDYRGERIANEKPGFVLVLCGGTGEPGTVKASSFGFDPEDSTTFLQRAFDSGARKIVVDRQASEWITRPLFITNSNVEVVLEEGVVLRAKRGAFYGTGDCLIRVTGNATNVVLRGQRWAALAMNKADYMDPAQMYPFAEWRHALSILSAADVTVRNLAILSSGGDGIYVNGARNVLLEDLVCHDHYRQGMSPISVAGLTVRRCSFVETRGTAPQSGIDMEPNAGNQRFADVVYEDCSFNGNAAHGIDIYLGNFSAKTRPLSIAFRRCVAKGNGACGFTFMAGSPTTVQESGSVGGFVRFEDCRFEQNGNEAFKLMNHTAAGVEISFANCSFDARGSKSEAAIALSNSQLPLDFGGVRFDGCEALVDANRQAMTFEAPRGIGIAGRLEGTLDVVRDGSRSRFDLAAFAAANAPHPELVTHFRSATVDFRQVEPVPAGASLKGTFTPSIRSAFVYVQTVPAAGEYAVSFHSSFLRGGDASTVCGVVQLLDRAGTDLGSFEIPPGDFAYFLKANGPNVYRFEVSPRNSGVIAVGSTTPGCALLMDKPVHFFHASGAKFHFHMPAGAREALVDVGPEEAAAVRLLDGSGNVLDEMPLQTAGMVLKGVKDGAGDEVWTLQLDRLVEDCNVQLGGDAVPLGSTEREGVIRN